MASAAVSNTDVNYPVIRFIIQQLAAGARAGTDIRNGWIFDKPEPELDIWCIPTFMSIKLQFFAGPVV